MVAPYSSNVYENSHVQLSVWIHRLRRENLNTMSGARMELQVQQLENTLMTGYLKKDVGVCI